MIHDCNTGNGHLFAQPVYDGELCQCGAVQLCFSTRPATKVDDHLIPDDPEPSNPLDITKPESILNPMNPLSPIFGGGRSGGAGASGDW